MQETGYDNLYFRVGEKWQEMPDFHPKTLSSTLPLPRERVKALKH
jgi:hypothetical protein